MPRDSAGERSYLRWILFLFGLFVLSLLNWCVPFLGYSGPLFRFEVPALNTIFGLFTLSVPWIVFVLLVKSRRFRARTLLALVLVPMMVLTIPAGLLVGMLGSDKPLKTVDMGGYRVRLHLLDCGAPCSFSLAVDQERVLIPPLILSKRLYTFDPAADAKTEILANNVLRVTTVPYNEAHPEALTQVFEMRPHFFF